MSEPVTRGGWFMTAAAWVGDLGNPFYDEERNRDVWNEASAVGFQIVLWLVLSASAVAVWVVGARAVPYAVAGYVVIGVASLVTVAYAERLGVEVSAPTRMRRLRMVPFLVLLVVLFAGLAVRLEVPQPDDVGSWFRSAWSDGTILGLLVGVGVVISLFALVIRWANRPRDGDRVEPG